MHKSIKANTVRNYKAVYCKHYSLSIGAVAHEILATTLAIRKEIRSNTGTKECHET
jgi:hypothetical protein